MGRVATGFAIVLVALLSGLFRLVSKPYWPMLLGAVVVVLAILPRRTTKGDMNVRRFKMRERVSISCQIASFQSGVIASHAHREKQAIVVL